jgi:glutamate racemase
MNQPIGVFDSGYGGLTVLREIVHTLPQYDYLYLGDNARTPYGTRSFDTVYQYTLECVRHLFDRGCRLVILACNTASAKALRNIQQLDLPTMYPGLDGPDRRVLGVIRPTTEVIGTYSKTGQVGILATRGTVTSESYRVEIEKFFPGLQVFQEACPMWVPLVENGEYDSAGADYFVQQHIDRLVAQSPDIDTILLACTHYPLLLDKIRQYVPGLDGPDNTTILTQGSIVADSLADYLIRHPELEQQISQHGRRTFLTTDSTEDFDRQATVFYGESVRSEHLAL